MLRPPRILTLLVLLITSFTPRVSVSLFAQPMQFGEPFALTNTRYPSAVGFQQELRTDGRDTYLFWTTRFAVRMTVLDGTRRAGVPAVATLQHGEFDAMWVGTHFVVAATSVRQVGALSTQGVGTRGEVLSTPYTIAEAVKNPRLAWNGSTLLLLYESGEVVRSIALSRSGRPVDGTREIVASNVSGRAEVVPFGTGFAAITTSFVPGGTEARLTTFHPTGKIASSKLLPSVSGASASATNGRELFLVGEDSSRNMQGAIVRADGLTKTAPIHTWPFGADLQRPAVTWDGTGWTAAYAERKEAFGVVSFLLHVTRVDREGRVLSREETTGFGTPSLLMTSNGVRAAFMREPTTNPPLLVATLPLADNEPEVVTYAAATQQLLATAASHEATLFLWEELGDDRRTLFAGLRSNDGEWRERRIGDGFSVQNAASNGSGFVMLFYKPEVVNSSAATALDSKLRTLWTTPIDSRLMKAIASNGDDYALAGVTFDGDLTAVLLSSSGVLGPPVVVAPMSWPEQVPSEPQIASDGEGFFVTWLTPACTTIVCGNPVTVAGARLNANLQRVDATDLRLNPIGEIGVARTRVAWDGSRYVVAWLNGSSLFTSTVPPSGAAQPSPPAGSTLRNADLGPMTGLRNGAALAWTQFGENNDYVGFFSDGKLAGKAMFGRTQHDSLAHVTCTPDGRALYATSRLESRAPHHRITRIVAAVEDPIPIGVPDAPSLTARFEGGAVVLRWTAPAQPVNGYRVEYRIGDGSWNELERWFTPDELSATFRASGEAVHAFRVHAWSDAGTGEYSEVAAVGARKRRAARR